MSKPSYKITAFGRDCLGNISGYRVDRHVWVSNPLSARADGLIQDREIAGQFCGDIYVDGSFDVAKRQAENLCSRLNREL